MASNSELVSYIHRWDEANGHLLTQLKALGSCQEPVDNIGICRQAEAKLAEQDSLLKTYKECSDKQLQWIRNAMDAIHPECDVTSNPESLRGKTLRLSQTAEIERLKEINNNLIEANERLSARVADWDEVCKALWDRGYCQLPQRVNETPLGSCLRLIAEGSPDPAKGQAGRLSGGYTVGVDMGVGELSKSATPILEKYRLPGSDEWKPCHKLVNRTPEA